MFSELLELAFSAFHVLIFPAGHVLPLHKRLSKFSGV